MYRHITILCIAGVLSLVLCGCKTNEGFVPPEDYLEEERSGFAYVGGFANDGAKAIFMVETPTGGTYSLAVRGAASSARVGTGSLYVNGVKTARLEFTDREKWEIQKVDVSFPAGNNTVSIQKDGEDNGLFYLDYIEF